MRIECYSWSDVSEQILEQAIALQNSAFEDMKGNFYQVDIPYKLVLAIDDNQVIGHVASGVFDDNASYTQPNEFAYITLILIDLLSPTPISISF